VVLDEGVLCFDGRVVEVFSITSFERSVCTQVARLEKIKWTRDGASPGRR
jgi:hypothetical protein